MLLETGSNDDSERSEYRHRFLHSLDSNPRRGPAADATPTEAFIDFTFRNGWFVRLLSGDIVT